MTHLPINCVIALALIGVLPTVGTAQFDGVDAAYVRTLLDRLEQATEQISAVEERDSLFVEIAYLWNVTRHRERARSLAAKVSNPGPSQLSELMKRGLIDSPEAIHKVVQRCELPCQRDMLWLTASRGFLGQQNVELARALADSIQGPSTRINALQGVLETQARTDPNEAELTLQKILSIARGVTDPELRTHAINGAINAAIASNNLPIALQLAAEEPIQKHLEHLGHILRELLRIGDPREDSIRTLLIKVSERIPDPALRKENLNYYVWVRESAGVDDVRELERIAERLEIDPGLLAGAIWNVGMDRIHAGRLQGALEVIPSLKRLNQMADVAEILTRVADAANQRQIPQSETVSEPARLELLEEANRITRSIEDPQARNERLASTAFSVAEAEPERALSFVHEITDQHYRDEIRLAVFRALLAQNSARAIEIAALVEAPASKVGAYRQFVYHQFSLSKSKEAAAVVHGIRDPELRRAVRAELASLWKRNGRPNQALGEYRTILRDADPARHYGLICAHVVPPMLSLGRMEELQAWAEQHRGPRRQAFALMALSKGVIESVYMYRTCGPSPRV